MKRVRGNGTASQTHGFASAVRKTKTAVLYARYSSHNQREVSIEDQLRVCSEYCARENIDIINVYHDSAMTGTNDKRPDFQRMIANAPESDYIVVYMMERFSRDKYDAPIYKMQLERKGVKVISALEFIPDTPEGVLIEKMIEGQAAYYSLKLSRDVRRGLTGNAMKCMANGYRVFGYDIDPETQKYVVNEEQARIVKEVFARYLSGETMNAIADTLAHRGFKTKYGNPVNYNFVHHLLHNEKYIGIYRWSDVEVPDGVPPIISRETFYAAQSRPHRKVRKMEEWTDYPLSGKLYCAICGRPLHGQSARNHAGKRYNYYACDKKYCDRKPVRKEIIEDALTTELKKFGNPETARLLAQACIAAEPDKNVTIEEYKKALKKNERARKALVNAIAEETITTEEAKPKMESLRLESERLEGELGMLEAQAIHYDEDELAEFLTMLFETVNEDFYFEGMLNRVFLFDGYMVATLNFRNEGTATELEEVEIALADLAFPHNPSTEKNQSPRPEAGSHDIRLAAQSNPCANFPNIIHLNDGLGFLVSFDN